MLSALVEGTIPANNDNAIAAEAKVTIARGRLISENARTNRVSTFLESPNELLKKTSFRRLVQFFPSEIKKNKDIIHIYSIV